MRHYGSLMLTPLDLGIIAVYLLGVTAFGISLRGRKRSLREYFLADGDLPWWAIAFSIVAAETSVLTIISTPGLSFAGNLGFLQLVFGYLAARILICLILIPAYYRGSVSTAYELLQVRFGPRLRALAGAIFLVGRSLAEGVRVFAMVIVIGVIADTLPAGWHLPGGTGTILAGIALLTLLYTLAGGLRAVVWTDFIQICIYVTGAVASLILLLHAVPGGWAGVRAAAAPSHKLQVFDFNWSWTQPYTFAAGFFGGTFLTMATHGTDQLMVQRLLAAGSRRKSSLALLSSWIVIFGQFLLFLLIGVALYACQGGRVPVAAAGAFGKYDRLYPLYVAQHLPAGLAGLVLAAILAASMSNLSAALNALSSSAILDFYKPRLAPGRSEAHYLRASRIATVGWMAVLGVVAYASRHSHSVLESGLAILSYPFGALLGVFLLGTLTRRADERGAIVGVVAGIAIALWLAHLGVAYTWFVVAGTLVTFAVGYAVSRLVPQPQP